VIVVDETIDPFDNEAGDVGFDKSEPRRAM